MAALRSVSSPSCVADLRERTRSPRFWVVLVGMMVAALVVLSRAGCRPYMIVAVHGGERGAYSSAWVGMVLATVFSTLLSLCGFYLVRGTLVRDIDTRVWQLLVATPMTRARLSAGEVGEPHGRVRADRRRLRWRWAWWRSGCAPRTAASTCSNWSSRCWC